MPHTTGGFRTFFGHYLDIIFSKNYDRLPEDMKSNTKKLLIYKGLQILQKKITG